VAAPRRAPIESFSGFADTGPVARSAGAAHSSAVMRHSLLLATVLVGWSVNPAAVLGQKDADTIVEPSMKVPRGKQLEWRSAQGRPYWYRLPKVIDTKTPPDLVVMLHGSGGRHFWSFANYPIAGDGGNFRKRDIVVSPDGCTQRGETFEFIQGPKDGEQIAGLISDFKKRFPIGRVYLYGHSQGAFFCYWFAGEHPELVDGIVAHAGNVLDVKHDKLAKQKVAICILHGRADAVVPVDCAIRTEKIYRDEGYTKLKLELVDGLTADSGHWPLPDHVAKMLEWCDQVSTQSAAQAVRTAASELQKQKPDLAIVADQITKARKLLPKADEADKKALPPQLDALQAFVDKVVQLHGGALLAQPATIDPKAAFGAWAPDFVAANRALGDHAEWKKLMAKPRELAARHDKAIEKALKGLEKPTKDSRAAACKCYEDAFLSARGDELRTALLPVLEAAGAAEAAAKERVVAPAKERGDVATAAAKTARERITPPLDELKAAQPALFVTGDEAATDEGK
jgi:dienelactone hydrolase